LTDSRARLGRLAVLFVTMLFAVAPAAFAQTNVGGGAGQNVDNNITTGQGDGGSGQTGTQNNNANVRGNNNQINQANCIAGRDCNIQQTNQKIQQGGVTRVVQGGRPVAQGGGPQGAGHAHAAAPARPVRVAAAQRQNFPVRRVALARTGFDSWMLLPLGGLALTAGLGLLAAQRRRNGVS
jgi:hypothetical protein